MADAQIWAMTMVFVRVFVVISFGAMAGVTTCGIIFYGERFLAKRRYYRTTRIRNREYRKSVKQAFKTQN